MEMWGFAGSMAADVFSKEKRSDIMRKIRAKNTRWERNFRGELSRRKLRYRVHYGADDTLTLQPFTAPLGEVLRDVSPPLQ